MQQILNGEGIRSQRFRQAEIATLFSKAAGYDGVKWNGLICTPAKTLIDMTEGEQNRIS